MSILSITLTPQLESFIDSMVQSGRFENRVAVVIHALKKMAEEESHENV
jgi:putative addiction module CopG family antidote